MAHDLNLSLVLRLNNQMTAGFRLAMTDAGRQTQNLTRYTVDLSRVTTQSNRALHQTGTTATSTARSMSDLTRNLHTASAEMARLARVEQSLRPVGLRLVEAQLVRINELARSTGGVLKGAFGVGLGAFAGGAVLKSAADRPMTYDRRLALLSNTANYNLDKAGRIGGKAQLDAGIRRAVNAGGGTPEQALDALGTLVGSGAFGGANESMQHLPTLMKFATGTGADASELAQIMIAAKQTMGIGDKDMSVMLSKAIRAGQVGGFDLPDMAKWLPQQMSLASSNGMKGMKGFESLLAANQVSKITTGTTDEAGNNLVNLLAKINSQDTAKDFSKLGIDLPSSLAKARGKGQNPLEFFALMVENISSRDAEYNKLKNKANHEDGADQKATYGAMADIMMQKGIGKTVQDRQALMMLLAMIQQKAKYQEVLGEVGKESGAEGDTSYAVVADSVDAKAEQLGNKKAFAALDTLSAVNDPLSKLLDKANQLAEEHSKLAAAAYSASLALGALVAAAGAGMLGRLVTSGGASAASGAAMGAYGGRAIAGWRGAASSMAAMSLFNVGMVPAAATGAAALFASGAGFGVGYGINKGVNALGGGEYLDIIAKPIAEMIEDILREPIKVEVDVKNGNIVAEVKKQQEKDSRRQ